MEYREPKPWKNVLNHSGTGTKETTLIPVVEEITSMTLIDSSWQHLNGFESCAFAGSEG
jgi:hypothetical protein